MTISYLSKAYHVTDSDEGDKRLGSAGIARTDVEVRIVDEEDRSVPAGQIGEIAVAGDVVMKGYLKDPEATAEAMRNGWLHTGDVGYMNERGFIYIMDRMKDMIISGGSNIYPRELEEVILKHPAVQEVVVIGIPDPIWGESVKAIVVRRPGAVVSEEDVIGFCREHIASYKKPKSVEFTDSIPKNAYGKVLRREIREPYWKGSARRV